MPVRQLDASVQLVRSRRLSAKLQHWQDKEIRVKNLSADGNGICHWFHERMTFATGLHVWVTCTRERAAWEEWRAWQRASVRARE